MTAIRQSTTVKPNGVIELHSLDLCPGEQVEVIILVNAAEGRAESTPLSFLDVAEKLDLKGPPDWSERLDDYLYGDKQNAG